MNDQQPVIALVHGAFAESASWNGVIERLQAKGLDAIAIGNPLRSLTIDATYVRDVITGLGRPVVLVGPLVRRHGDHPGGLRTTTP